MLHFVLCYISYGYVCSYIHTYVIIFSFLDKNILVHQECACDSPLLCSCPYGGRVTYVLGDMGLFWIDKQQLSGKYVDWAKAKYSEPAGTDRMKASEVRKLFFS